MKAFTITLLVLTVGVSALANVQSDIQNKGIEMRITLDNGGDHAESPSKIAIGPESEITRLYKFQNARIKKALSFTTRPSKQRWA